MVLVVIVSSGDDSADAGVRVHLITGAAVPAVDSAVRTLRKEGTLVSRQVAMRALATVRTQRDTAYGESLRLTPRERDLVQMLTKDATYLEAARALGISINTVRQHVRNVYVKLEVSSKAELVALTAAMGTG